MKNDVLFTVFTPTYNRAHTLDCVYNSLKSQTYKDFKWLIVDDGSTDGTCELIEQRQQEAEFLIRYTYQENSGKHIAINRGVGLARGQLFLIADSDDAFVSQTLQRFHAAWLVIPDNERVSFPGVYVLCQTPDGNIVGDPFPASVVDATPCEIVYRYKVQGEKWGFMRTDVIREFPFPKELSRTLVPESLVWRPIGKKYKTRFINEPLRIYYEDQPNYMRRGRRVTYAWGGRQEHLYYLNEEFPIRWRYAPLVFLRSVVLYSRYSFHLKFNLISQVINLHHPLVRILWLVGLPLALILYLRDSLVK